MMNLFGKKDDAAKPASEMAGGPSVETALPSTAPETGQPGGGGSVGGGVASRIATGAGGKPVANGSPADNPPPKRARRGRPPTHGRYSRRLGSDGKNPVKMPGPESMENRNGELGSAPRVGLPADLVKKIVKEGLTVAENTLHNAIDGKGKLAGLTTEEIEPQLKQAKLGDTQKNLVGELVPHALREWGMSPDLSPTAAIAVILGPWSFAGISAFMTLSTLAKEKAERELPPVVKGDTAPKEKE